METIGLANHRHIIEIPDEGVLSDPKRFYQTPTWPPEKNHRHGSIEPFASTPPSQVTLSNLSLSDVTFVGLCCKLSCTV